MTDEYDPFANRTIDDWRQAARKAEDAAATNALAWIRLRDASEGLIAEVRRLRAERNARTSEDDRAPCIPYKGNGRIARSNSARTAYRPALLITPANQPKETP
jgi:hypothetical protein